MKIALLHYAVRPVIGGVESILASHARLFATAGHEVITVARQGDADHVLKSTDPLPELRLATRGCDMIVVHNVLTMPFDLPLTGALWALAAETPAVRWIAWIHDLAAVNPDYDHPWHRAPWDRLAKASPAFTYVAVSRHRAEQFAALTGVVPQVIPNGVDPEALLGLSEKVRQLSARHRLLRRELVLIHPTRLLRRKNVEFGLEVVAELRSSGRDAASLITAASDPHNPKSASYASELRLLRDDRGLQEHALFVADEFRVEQEDLVSLFALADALLFPSRQEGFGLPVLEAALHRLPIFAADVEPVNSLVTHGVHVFDPDGSPAEAARLIERTLDRTASFQSRREVLQRYAWSAVWEKHLAPLLEAR
jgi:mannosylglucosylglycerate synthase